LSAPRQITVQGPYFEDFAVGQLFADAPGLTLTDGHAALHQAIAGDRLRLALDGPLCQAVTGRRRILAHPNLACDVAIGQSTGPTRRVRGNLFYRGLVLLEQVFIGDTLSTRTEVIGLKQNRNGTGLVALRITTVNQRSEPVLDFWRCPMIPLRDPGASTGHADRFDDIPEELDLDRVRASVPAGWDLDVLAQHGGDAERFADLEPGTVYVIEGGDTVTSAPELARLTLNLARAHTDAGGSPHGRRLVYGGHTISIAAAHATRALPGLVTLLAWRRCDHRGPVFEGDVLSTELTVEGTHGLTGSTAGLADLRAVVQAERAGADAPAPVLDWRFVGLMV